MHVYLFKQMVTFLAITCFTASHQILPCTLSTTRARYHVIECQLAGMLAAILARFIIAQQDVGASGVKHRTRYANISEQLHNDGSFQLKTACANALLNQL